MEGPGEAQSTKLKGYILGLTFTSIAGVILGWTAPLLELANQSGNALASPLLYIAILLQLAGGILNFFALSYLRPAIVFPVYGSIQIFESVIVAQILLPATNPWSNLFYASLVLIVASLVLIAYSISKKPEEEVVDLLPPNPQVVTPDEILNEGFQDVFKLLDINLMGAYGRIKHRWAHSGKKYTKPNILESCFTSLVWKLWLPEIATEILESFFDAQTADGRLPSKLKMLGRDYCEVVPIVAYCVAAQNPSNEFLKQVFPKLKAFQQWWYENRQSEGGLFFWETPEESGMSGAARFGNLNTISHIIPVDLNAYIVLQNNVLAQIAASLDLPELVKQFEKQASDLTEKVQTKLWDSDSNLYYDWDSDKNEFIRIMGLTNFIPLVAKIPTREQTNSLISHLTNTEEFNTLIPYPSVSISDEKYMCEKWNGAVSLNLVYLILQGLQLYQENELIAETSFRLIQGVFSHWELDGSFYEFYSPNPLKYDLTAKPGKDFVGSTGLINTLLVEEIIGLKITNSEIILCPKLPPSWKTELISYSIPTRNLVLTMEYKESEEIQIKLVIDTKEDEFVIKNFEEKRVKL